jgi:hypothetical protein
MITLRDFRSMMLPAYPSGEKHSVMKKGLLHYATTGDGL